MNFLIFAASHRTDSLNRKLAELVASQVASSGMRVNLVDYEQFDMPIYNDQIANTQLPEEAYRFARYVEPAHGVIICSPEYNWSYPASLKNIIDWTSRIKPAPITGKTALLMSATPGARGGIGGLMHLKTPCEALGLFVFPKMFALGRANEAFDNTGELADSKQRSLCKSLVNDYIAYTEILFHRH